MLQNIIFILNILITFVHKKELVQFYSKMAIYFLTWFPKTVKITTKHPVWALYTLLSFVFIFFYYKIWL